VLQKSSIDGGMSNWLSSMGGTSWSQEAGLGYVFISASIYLMSLFVAAYTHDTIDVANLPLMPLFILLCISAILTATGLLGFRNRDILTKS